MSAAPSSSSRRSSLRARAAESKGRRRYDAALKAELVQELKALMKQGHTLYSASSLLGLKSQTTKRWLDPTYAAEQYRKDTERRYRYGKECKICGARTSGGDGRHHAPDYCIDHYMLDPKFKENRENRKRMRQDQIVQKFQEWAELYGEPPSGSDWNPHQSREKGHIKRAERWEQGDWPWFSEVFRTFGSWNEAMQAAGFEPRRSGGFKENAERRETHWEEWTGDPVAPPFDRAKNLPKREKATSKKGTHGGRRKGSGPGKYWTAERIIEKFHEWNEQYGVPPTADQWNIPYPLDPETGYRIWPTISAVKQAFGSWSRAKRQAGYQPYYEKKVLRGESSTPNKKWTKEEMLEALDTYTKKTGLPPTRASWQRKSDDHPNASVVSAAFGSWNEAIRQSGHQPLPSHVTRRAVAKYLPMRKEGQ